MTGRTGTTLRRTERRRENRSAYGFPTPWTVGMLAFTVGLSPDQSAQAKFIERVTPQVGPPLVIGPTGSTDTRLIVQRLNAEVLFNRKTPAQAADEFVKQVEAAIGK